MLESRFELQYQIKKNISIDKYDTDSDEEDHLREEEEIKRIITKGNLSCQKLIDQLAKLKNNHLPTKQQDNSTYFNEPKLMPTSITHEQNTKNQEIILKSKSHQGFFPPILGSLEQLDKKKGTIENFESRLQDFTLNLILLEFFSLKHSKEKRKDQATTTLQTYYVDFEKQGSEELAQRVTGTSQTKFKDNNKITHIDQEFQKRSFQNLLSLFNNSTSNKPTKLFAEKVYFSQDKSPSKIKKTLQSNKPASNFPSNFDERENSGKFSKKQYQKYLCDLISAFALDAYEPIDKGAQYEIPRIKMIDWSSISKKSIKILFIYLFIY